MYDHKIYKYLLSNLSCQVHDSHGGLCQPSVEDLSSTFRGDLMRRSGRVYIEKLYGSTINYL